MSRDWRWFLSDMLDAAKRARDHLGNLNAEQLAADRKTLAAVERELAILGEAAKHVPADARARHPQVDWRQMAGLRDVLNHAYFQVDAQVLWQVVREELPGNIEALAVALQVERIDQD